MVKKKRTVNLTPDPKILITIARNPLSPINALCELIDNSIDGFHRAKKEGYRIAKPKIVITLPSFKDLDEGCGMLTIEDNGPGLSVEEAQNAVTAGYSGNKNPLDTLGLFGMGFNIATGKLGRRTVFKTSQREDKKETSLIIDLDDMVKQGSFDVPVVQREKQSINASYTRIEISEWWPQGDQNYQFINKLRQLRGPKIREQLGRIYASLEEEGVNIIVEDDSCKFFHHCVWSDSRFVIRHNNKIPAKINFDQVIGTEVRCNKCWTLLDGKLYKCPKCKSKSALRTIEKRISGWVGIQRFDDKDMFGIDLIRNGRAIRIFEREAFFTWIDPDSGKKEVDYPIDNPYGRIIGEIHIDFVPVDYLKSDFQRTSPEWVETVKFLRGETSLQPRKGGVRSVENNSPIYKLYQGYRSVRDVGKKDLYMGYWDESAGKAMRISRQIEEEYYSKFLKREPGYFDDEKWYLLVEQADIQPLPELKECPECGTQNPENREKCVGCTHIFIGKKCINPKCGIQISLSDQTCEHCGTIQINEEQPWGCQNCGFSNNPPDEDLCMKCSEPRGTLSSLNPVNLLANSNVSDDLSISNFTIPLPNNESSAGIRVTTHIMKKGCSLIANGKSIPVFMIKDPNEISFYLDLSHDALSTFQDRPEDYIAMELANFVNITNGGKVSQESEALWSLSSLYYEVHNHIWRSRIELNPQETKQQIEELFSRIFEQLPHLLGDEAVRVFDNLSQEDQGLIMQSIVKFADLNKLQQMKESGEYLKYIPEAMVVKLVTTYPEKFFDGGLWTDPYATIQIDDLKALSDLRQTIVSKYTVNLEDLINYKNYRNPEANYTQKINQTLKIVTKTFVTNE